MQHALPELTASVRASTSPAYDLLLPRSQACELSGTEAARLRPGDVTWGTLRLCDTAANALRCVTLRSQVAGVGGVATVLPARPMLGRREGPSTVSQNAATRHRRLHEKIVYLGSAESAAAVYIFFKATARHLRR